MAKLTPQYMIDRLTEIAESLDATGAPGEVVMALQDAADDIETAAHQGRTPKLNDKQFDRMIDQIIRDHTPSN